MGVDTVKTFILLLEESDYHCGPVEDYHFSGEVVWVFSKWINTYQTYIKLQIRDNEGWIISFHEAKYSMGDNNA